MEIRTYNEACSYSTYPNYGVPIQPYIAGDGLLAGHMSYDQLSHNGKDIESYLFGIGSTNLVDPKSPVQPLFNTPKSLNIISRIPIIMPNTLEVKKNQRPYPMN